MNMFRWLKERKRIKRNAQQYAKFRNEIMKVRLNAIVAGTGRPTL